MNREQLNTDLLINLNVCMNINNMLLLTTAKISREDKEAVEKVINESIDKNNSLSDKSRELDEKEK